MTNRSTLTADAVSSLFTHHQPPITNPSSRTHHQPRTALFALLALAIAGCPRGFLTQTTPAPRVLPPSPALEQVIQAVNYRSAQIQSISSSSATLSGPGYPTLRANLAFQRPRFFRLRAETGLTGSEVDLGSNDQVFWFWVRRNEPPAVYFCRHDQFLTSRARQMIPIDPNWLIEALGVADFDPALPHQGPYPDKDNRIRIHTIRETPEGPTTRVTIVDAATAWVMEQHIFDAQGRLKASSVAEGYRRDPLSGLYLPSAVKLSCPAAGFSMRLDLGNAQINRLSGNPAELWSMPSYPGTPVVDLCDPNLVPPPVAAPPAVSNRPRRDRPRLWQ